VYIENFRTRHSSVGNCFAISSSAALELLLLLYNECRCVFPLREESLEKQSLEDRGFFSWQCKEDSPWNHHCLQS
jgi:hypothetical protein